VVGMVPVLSVGAVARWAAWALRCRPGRRRQARPCVA